MMDYFARFREEDDDMSSPRCADCDGYITDENPRATFKLWEVSPLLSEKSETGDRGIGYSGMVWTKQGLWWNRTIDACRECWKVTAGANAILFMKHDDFEDAMQELGEFLGIAEVTF